MDVIAFRTTDFSYFMDYSRQQDTWNAGHRVQRTVARRRRLQLCACVLHPESSKRINIQMHRSDRRKKSRMYLLANMIRIKSTFPTGFNYERKIWILFALNSATCELPIRIYSETMRIFFTVWTRLYTAGYYEYRKYIFSSNQFTCIRNTNCHKVPVTYPRQDQLHRRRHPIRISLSQCLLVAADIRWNIYTSTLSRICTTLYRNLFHRSSELEAPHTASLKRREKVCSYYKLMFEVQYDTILIWHQYDTILKTFLTEYLKLSCYTT